MPHQSQKRVRLESSVLNCLFAAHLFLFPLPLPAHDRPRIIIETDAGADPDDGQSLVRFLLYTNEFDVEGIACALAKAIDKENLNPERTGLDVFARLKRPFAIVAP